MLYEASTGEITRVLTGHACHNVWIFPHSFIVRFSADGRYLVSLCSNHRLLVWDVMNGRLVGVLHKNESKAHHGKGRPKRPREGEVCEILAEFIPNTSSKLLAVGHCDGTATFWRCA
jgi:WD40 repeat protein